MNVAITVFNLNGSFDDGITRKVFCLDHVPKSGTVKNELARSSTSDNCGICSALWYKEYNEVLSSIDKWTNGIKHDDVVYIAGPMTGYVDYNRKSFFVMEHALKTKIGCSIQNPARNDSSLTYQQQMEIDIKMVLSSTAIVMLKGWEKSKGAKVEHDVANITNKKIFLQL